MDIVHNVLPEGSLCGWPRNLASPCTCWVQQQNHPIMRLTYTLYQCHMIGEDFVFLSFLYIKLFELGVQVAVNNQIVTTQSICLNSHFGAATLGTLIMLLYGLQKVRRARLNRRKGVTKIGKRAAGMDARAENKGAR